MCITPLTNQHAPTLEAFLLPQINSSLFILSNMSRQGLESSGESFSGRYFGSFVADALESVVVQYWNGMIMMQGTEAGVAAIWQQAKSEFQEIKGFIGPAHLCAVLKEAYESECGSRVLAMEADDRLYTLLLANLKVPVQIASQELRVRFANEKDIDILLPWMIDYEVQALGATPGPELEAEQIKCLTDRLSRKVVFVLEDEAGTLLATSGFNAQYRTHVQVGAVWTPPALRGQGYGRSVVAGSLLLAAEQGADSALLFTDEPNIGAIRAYESLGFEHIGAFGLYLYAY